MKGSPLDPNVRGLPARRLPVRVSASVSGASAAGLLLVAALMAPSTSRALPSFARQMDMQCIDCHTEFPILNQFGRQFKLSGYTLSSDPSTTSIPPIAFMLQPSFTNTQAGQAGGAAPGFGNNNNFAVTQVSVFYAGRLLGPYADQLFSKDVAAILDKIGIFSQTTYDGVGKAWNWDNTELRFANTTSVHDQSVVYGVYANNNPTLQDPWNSTPAWGFPFSGSGLAPTPAAGTLIEGGLSQEVVGVGAYTMVADTFYFDLGAYHTPGPQLQYSLGIDPTGETQIAGLAPYWRIAIDRLVGEAHWEIGTFGMAADTYPGRVQTAGQDRITDFGLDSQYQVSSGPHDITAMVSYVYERQKWGASYALGNSSNPTDTLNSFKATVDYLYDKTFGGAVQYFLIDGSSDGAIYSGSQTGSPTSDGVLLALNYLPFNKSGGPAFWPRSNIKFSLQYAIYNRFNGARTNYDGAGSNAQGNNTLYIEAWIVF
jgi:hypothetical protein